MYIYIASDMFSIVRKEKINSIARVLRAEGHGVYVPHEHQINNAWELSNREWAKAVFEEDIKAIDLADTIYYVCEGMCGDIGSAWECGYAYAKGKKIKVILTNQAEIYNEKISLMVAQSCDNIRDIYYHEQS